MPTQNYGEKLKMRIMGKKLKYQDANSELWGKTHNFGMPTQNYGEKLKMRIMGKNSKYQDVNSEF